MHCCELMEVHSVHVCKMHVPRDCPDVLVLREDSRFFLPIRDGGDSKVELCFCPFCGVDLEQFYERGGTLKYEVTSDGKTVWVNGVDGLVGRFSARGGIDVHREISEQAELGQCLFCKPGPANKEDWRAFVNKMYEHFKVRVSNVHMPKELRGD